MAETEVRSINGREISDNYSRNQLLNKIDKSKLNDNGTGVDELWSANKLNAQFNTKVSFKIPTDTNSPWSWFDPISDVEIYGGAINKISIRTNIYSRGIEIYNQSGITDGSITDLAKSKESFVIHHYSDNNVAQIDNVGRSNAILILKNARNSVMAKHNETGRGDYLRCDRDDEVEGIQNLFRIKALNWKDEGITSTDRWSVCLLGKIGGTNKQVTQQPIMVLSKGVSSSEKGEVGMYIYSLPYGNSCLKLTNSSLSDGANLNISAVSTQSNTPGINIDCSGSSPAMIITNKGKTIPFLRFMRTTASYGNLIEMKNESNVDLFKISGNGKSIFLTDSGDSTLREIKIVNGVLTVV